MKKIFSWMAISLAALFVLVGVGRNWIIGRVAEAAVTNVTGFKTTLEKVQYDFPSTIQIKGLKIRNPPEFRTEVLADVPEIYVSLSPGELLSGKRIHLYEMRLNMQEVNIEKNKDGISNISRLTSLAQSAGAPRGKEGRPVPKAEQKGMPFQLDRVDLTLRNVVMQDYSGGLIPRNVSVDLHVENEVKTNITNPEILVSWIILKVVTGAAFGNLGIDPTALQGSLSEGFATGEKLLGQSSVRGEKMLGEAVDSLSSAAKSQVSGLFDKLKEKVQ